MHDYSEFQQSAPSAGDMASLSSLAHDLYLAETELAEAEKKVAAAKKRVMRIADEQIPELMAQIGIAEFTTSAGIKLSIKDVVRASIPVARRPEAHNWLKERGHGDMVKRTVLVAFARGEEERAAKLQEELTKKGHTVKDEEKVESATLRKFVREQLEAGEMIPLDLFGAAKFQQAKITSRPESAFGD